MGTFAARDIRAQKIFLTSVKKLRKKSIGIRVFKMWMKNEMRSDTILDLANRVKNTAFLFENLKELTT